MQLVRGVLTLHAIATRHGLVNAQVSLTAFQRGEAWLVMLTSLSWA